MIRANSVIFAASASVANNVHVNNLIIDNVTAGLNSTAGAAVEITPPNGATWTFDTITVKNSNINLPITGLVYVNNGGTPGTLTVHQINVKGNTLTGTGMAVYASAATNLTLGMVNISENNISGTTGLYSGYVAAQFNVTNNQISGTTGVISRASGVNASYCGNSFSGATSGIYHFTSSNPAIVSSCGNNILSGGSVWISGTGTPTVYGWDIQCNVANNSRTTGEFCYNTNTAPGSGTLNTAGPVMDQGTSANSWFLMANPSGQTF